MAYVFNSQIIKGLATLVSGIGIGAVVVTGLHSFEGTESLQNSENNVVAYVRDAQHTLDDLSQQIENDKNIIESHLNMLDDEPGLKEIYEMISNSIHRL
mgnify:CR=1 FL=1